MHVDEPSVVMQMHGAVSALPRRVVDRTQAEADQHQRHRELEPVGCRRRQLGAQDDEHDAGRDQRQRVSEPPAGAHPGRLDAAALPGDERRDRGEMIRLEGVAHPEQRSEARAGHEFE